MQSFEIELKFALPPDAAPALEGHALLQAATSTDERSQTATYFDTPRHDFRRALVACRIRDEAGRRVQTVKAATADAISRREWEREAAADVPDVADVPLPGALRKAIAGAALEPMFRVNVERHIWVVTQGASLVEVAFDRGWILADARSAPVCSVELELKDGEPRDLFALARQLCADLPLHLDLQSNAQRGWALKDVGDGPATDGLAIDAPAPAMPRDAPFAQGLAALAQACLEPLAANAAVLRATRSPEALHRTRTAVRRLRALLRVFARQCEDDAFKSISGELKWLSQALGAARDIDVADERLKLGEALKARRESFYARVLDDFASPRYRRLLIDLAEWLSCGAWRTRRSKKSARSGFVDVAALEMHRWDKRIRKDAEELRALDAEDRHKLRIRAKSLAYVGELTAGLAARSTRKDHGAYVKAIKALQSTLGSLNDVRVSGALLDDLAPDLSRDALRAVTRRNARDTEKLEHKARKAAARFLSAPRPFDGV